MIYIKEIVITKLQKRYAARPESLGRACNKSPALYLKNRVARAIYRKILIERPEVAKISYKAPVMLIKVLRL